MGEVKWIKIASDIFDDDKILLIESMPEADSLIVIWFKLLCMAGKQNNSGVFMLNDKIAYTDEMLATIFRRPLNTVRLALQTFEQFGMIEIVNNAITIPNWEKHQKLDALEKARDSTRKRVAKFREKQKALISGTPEIEQEISSENECNVTGRNSNADRLDKIRLDKSRIDSNSSILSSSNNIVVVNNTKTRTRTREEPNHNDDFNPLGDGGPDHPVDTLEAYASRNIVNMNGRNMEFLSAYMDQLPEPLIRFAIDMANKHCKTGIPTFGYVDTILKGFVARKFTTVEQAKAAEEARQAQREQARPTQKTTAQESDAYWGRIPFAP